MSWERVFSGDESKFQLMLKPKKADRGKLAEFPKLKEGLIGWMKERKLINIRISKKSRASQGTGNDYED